MTLQELKNDIIAFERITNNSEKLPTRNIVLPLNRDDNYTRKELNYYKKEFKSLLKSYLSDTEIEDEELYSKINQIYEKYN